MLSISLPESATLQNTGTCWASISGDSYGLTSKVTKINKRLLWHNSYQVQIMVNKSAL